MACIICEEKWTSLAVFLLYILILIFVTQYFVVNKKHPNNKK